MAKLLTPTSANKLAELQLKQADIRRDIFSHHEIGELKAMLALAAKLFGNRGYLDAGPQEPGIIYIGRYYQEYDPAVPAHQRKGQLILRGHSHRELVDQARLLLRYQGDT